MKLTYSFSATGTTTLICISILGLTEPELYQDSCISLKINGLCVDEGGVTLGSSQQEMILSMRKKNLDVYFTLFIKCGLTSSNTRLTRASPM